MLETGTDRIVAGTFVAGAIAAALFFIGLFTGWFGADSIETAPGVPVQQSSN